MPSSDPRIVTPQVAQMVDTFIDDQIRSVARSSNLEHFDESCNFSLHRLAAAIYAQGYEDGERVEQLRKVVQRQRDRDRNTDAS